VSLAKAAHVAAVPGRVRAPRNFDRDIQLHLGPRGEGSTALPLMLVFGATLLAPYRTEFETAQSQFTDAIIAANKGQTPSMAPKYLGYFDKIGRSLRSDEGLEVIPNRTETVLTPETRKRLIAASQVNEWTEPATLRARVSMTDYGPDTFKLKLQDGTTVPGNMEPTFQQQLADAHYAYNTGGRTAWVLLDCVVRKERSGKVKSVDSIRQLTPLDPLDVTLRLAELGELVDGWLNGEGLAPKRDGLQWLSEEFERSYDFDLPLPHLYPTPEGGMQAEWMFGREDVSLNIDLNRKVGIYNRLNLDTDDAEDAEIALDDDTGWQKLNELLTTLQQRQDSAA
jgi:hypothetical protein